MIEILNRKISTWIGLMVILFAAIIAAWFMINSYINFMEMKLEPIKMEINNNQEK